MNSDELALEVGEFVKECQRRIVGIGHQQYAQGDTQRFEKMSLDGLFEYADEELRDIVNYAVMLHIRLERLRAVVARLDRVDLQRRLGA